MIDSREEEQALKLLIQAREDEQRRLVHDRDGLRQQLAEVEQRLGASRAELARYRADLHRLTPHDVSEDASNEEADVRLMRRTDAVAYLLSKYGPSSPSKLAERLTERGRSDGPRDVSSSLGALHRKGRARSIRRGLWESTDAHPDGDDR